MGKSEHDPRSLSTSRFPSSRCVILEILRKFATLSNTTNATADPEMQTLGPPYPVPPSNNGISMSGVFSAANDQMQASDFRDDSGPPSVALCICKRRIQVLRDFPGGEKRWRSRRCFSYLASRKEKEKGRKDVCPQPVIVLVFVVCLCLLCTVPRHGETRSIGPVECSLVGFPYL